MEEKALQSVFREWGKDICLFPICKYMIKIIQITVRICAALIEIKSLLKFILNYALHHEVL